MRDQVVYYLDRARAAARSRRVGTITEVKPAIDALVRTFGKIYFDRGIIFETSVPEGARFRGERQDLDDLVGAGDHHRRRRSRACGGSARTGDAAGWPAR
jgi:hypothetical protein